MRAVLVGLFFVGCIIAVLGAGDAAHEAQARLIGHGEVTNTTFELAALWGTAGLILMAVSGFGVSALTKLADMRDVLIRAQAANPGPNPYAALPSYFDPTKRG